MSRVNPTFTAFGVLGLVILASLCGPRRSTVVGQPAITGVLYSADADSNTTRAGDSPDDLPLPELRVGLDQSARGKLPPGLDFIVHLVPAGGSQLRLTGAQEATQAPRPSTALDKTAPREQKTHARTQHGNRRATVRQNRATPVPVAVSAPIIASAAVSSSATAPPQPAAPAAMPAPAPIQAMTFGELDDALRSSPLTQTLNLRLKLDDISFRITHVGRVGNREAVRFAIANAGNGDFFVSIINVAFGGKAIHSETAGPYSCGSGQEVFGIVHFASDIAAGKVITVELVQSGGEHHRFALKLPIPS